MRQESFDTPSKSICLGGISKYGATRCAILINVAKYAQILEVGLLPTMFEINSDYTGEVNKSLRSVCVPFLLPFAFSLPLQLPLCFFITACVFITVAITLRVHYAFTFSAVFYSVSSDGGREYTASGSHYVRGPGLSSCAWKRSVCDVGLQSEACSPNSPWAAARPRSVGPWTGEDIVLIHTFRVFRVGDIVLIHTFRVFHVGD